MPILPPRSQALPRRPPQDVTPRSRAGSFRARTAAFLLLRTRHTRVDRAVPVRSGATQSCNVGPRINVWDCDYESARSPTAGPAAYDGSYGGGARTVVALLTRPSRTCNGDCARHHVCAPPAAVDVGRVALSPIWRSPSRRCRPAVVLCRMRPRLSTMQHRVECKRHAQRHCTHPCILTPLLIVRVGLPLLSSARVGKRPRRRQP